MVIRPNKNGGCSVCKSPDARVGKGRCNHILDNVKSIKLIWSNDGGYMGNVGNVILNGDEETKIEVNESLIKEFLSSLENSLSEEQKERIINKLRKLE